MCAYSRRKCFSNKAISKWPLTSLSRSDSDLWKSCMAAAIVGDPEPACAHRHIHSCIHTQARRQTQTKTEKQQRKSDLNSYFHARDTKSTREHKQGDPIWSNTHRLAWCSDSHQCFLSWFESSRSEIAGGRRKRGEPPHLFWLQQHWWLKQQWLRDTTLTHRESRWTKCMATTESWWLCVRERRERDEKGKGKKGESGWWRRRTGWERRLC